MEVEFKPYTAEWEAAMNRLPKKMLIEMIRKHHTGTSDKKMCGIDTINDAQNAVEGIINDFADGISGKAETMRLLGEYTGRLMELFWDNAKKRIKENPELLND